MKLPVASRVLKEKARVHPFANLGRLAADYATLAALIGGAVWFDLWRSGQGLSWLWTLPVWLLAAGLVGCVQHRIALMGHEASHFLLHPNRRWNDVLAELLCFYPIFASVAKYRAKHLGHHLYPNDPDRDPNLGGGKLERFYSKFPMPRSSFVRTYYLKFFWPPFVLANLFDLARVVMLGGGAAGEADKRKKKGASQGRLGTVLGVAYLVALVLALRWTNGNDFAVWKMLAVGFGLALAVWAALPERTFFRGGNLAIPVKAAALLRLGFYTALFGSTALVFERLGYSCTLAFLALWVFPLVYVFPYLMLVREIFQHANAGQGELDNSRVMHVDPFTRWSLLGYGNDYHLIHHIYPNIPCYRLRELHELLASSSPEYAGSVDENFGVHRAPDPGMRPVLDSLSDPEGPGHPPKSGSAAGSAGSAAPEEAAGAEAPSGAGRGVGDGDGDGKKEAAAGLLALKLLGVLLL